MRRLHGPRLTVALVAGLVAVVSAGACLALWVADGHATTGSAAVEQLARTAGGTGTDPQAAASLRIATDLPPPAVPTTVVTITPTASAPTAESTSKPASVSGRPDDGSTGTGPATPPVSAVPTTSGRGAPTVPGTPAAATGTAATRGLMSAAPSNNLTVAVAPGVVLNTRAEAIASAVQRYFDAINQHDYDSWQQTVTASLAAQQSRGDWLHAYSTTTDSSIWIVGLDSGSVHLQFTSVQDVSLAPPALPAPCIVWRLSYALALRGGHWVIGSTSGAAVSMAGCP